MLENRDLQFLKSALAIESDVEPFEGILEWIRSENQRVRVDIAMKPLEELEKWQYDSSKGAISHQSGKFFSIEGIHVETNWGLVPAWEQPIINQPEIGFLGILTKKIHGVLHFLMQAKIEPGNINVVQLSPTLQATKSNYTRVHGGKTPAYLEYFNGTRNVRVLLDQLQSEQGARFLKKRNRNIIIEIPEEENIELLPNFRWLTLGQIKRLLRFDNIVNMDTRTVISGIPFGSYPSEVLKFYDVVSLPDDRRGRFYLQSILNRDIYHKSTDSIISWITDLKSRYELQVSHVPLKQVHGWIFDNGIIRHTDNKYFSVVGVSVSIDNREVVTWDQPMIRPAQEGLIAFLVKQINGVFHFLVQAKLEAGNHDIIELAPTVQCLTGNYRLGRNEYAVPFIDVVLNAKPDKIWYSACQSEEGGRFYKEQNRNMIVEVDEDFPVEVPENYCWMTLNQLHIFLKFNNYLNIASRSLLAAIDIS